jgi:hypothetical protein
MEESDMSDRVSTRQQIGMHHGNLLNPGVRRDIADLNRLFLERALDPVHATDPWFALPGGPAERLRTATSEARERAAQSPFTLFEVRMPQPADARPGDAVADAPGEGRTEAHRDEIRRAFGVAALAVVRRLTEGVPMSPRIAFGLEKAAEAHLCALSLSESYRVAAWPGLIRPRWSTHERFWLVLAEMAVRGEHLHWAYATGLCLLGPCERSLPVVQYGQDRRGSRPRHRPPRKPDVPC